MVSKSEGKESSKARSKNTLIATLLIVIVIVAVGAVAVLILNRPHPASPLIMHTMQIVNGNETVNGGAYLDYPFTVPSGASSVSVGGTFTASGGSYNDIKVYVFDSTNFNYYKNGQNFTSLYQSGQTTTGNIGASIVSSGNYYLVLDNKFSTTSQKTVDIQSDFGYYTN